MSEQTEAGRRFAVNVTHQLVTTIERLFWEEDAHAHDGDLMQHLYFFIKDKSDPYHIEFRRSSLDDCADPRNREERDRVEQYIRQQVEALFGS